MHNPNTKFGPIEKKWLELNKTSRYDKNERKDP